MKLQYYLPLFIILFSFIRGELAIAESSSQGFDETYLEHDCMCATIKKDVLDQQYKKLIKDDFIKVNSYGDDGSTKLARLLNFDFELFGNRIDSLYININGSLSLKRMSAFSTKSLRELSKQTIIAGYWADIDLKDDFTYGAIYYKYLMDKKNLKDTVGLSVVWYNVACYNEMEHLRATFSITLTNGDGQYLPLGDNVAFCYDSLGFSHGNATATCTAESSYPYEKGKAYCSGGGDVNDKNFDGFGGGTPATVGVRYSLKEDDGNDFYYYQVGRYDRPESKEESLDKENYPFFGSTNYIKYDGVNHLLAKSKSCQLSYDFRTTEMVAGVKCSREKHIIDVFVPLKAKENRGECKYVLYCNNVEIAEGNVSGAYIRKSVEVDPSNKYSLKLDFIENKKVIQSYEKEILDVPQCDNTDCPSDDWDININGEDLAASYCSNKLLEFSTKSKKGAELTNPKYTWSFSNSESSDLSTPEKTYTVASEQTVTVKITSDECKEGITLERDFVIDVCPVDSVCPTEFAPTAGKKYILSGWMHVEGAKNVTSYADYGSIEVKYEGSDQVDECTPSGDIIDEWQRIYKEIRIPDKATQLFFVLKSKENGKDCYFDDIRFLPIDASMVSYVYDPVTLRLVAELDNENYATFYEYDEEGALIRVKKETERGIMTIKEARQGGVKLK